MKEQKKSITGKDAEDLINSLLTINATELGIFISKLSHNYMKEYNVSKEDFIKSLSNSIDIMEEKEQEN